jgi:hypothetical protein
MKKLWKWAIIIGIIVLVLIVSAMAFLSMTVIAKKPAIYLYPVEDSFVNVKVDINGKMIKDIPSYNDGWNVYATKDGVINQKYDYLFYEAKLNQLNLPKEGWVVNSEDMGTWFDINLKKLGLNDKEASQFKEYWLNELPKSNYYEIKLLDKEFLDNNMALVINPQPDTVIRINLYFKPLKEIEQINEPNIISPTRNGFTVVEWGGILGK